MLKKITKLAAKLFIYLSILCYCLSSILFASKVIFGNYSINQLIFHTIFLKDSLSVIPWYTVLQITFGMILIILLGVLIFYTKKYSPSLRLGKYGLSCILYFLVSFCFFSFSYAPNMFAEKHSMVDYADIKRVLNVFRYSNFYEQNYVDGNTLKFQTANKKNIVILFVESLEQSFSNKQIFGENLLSDLENEKGLSFSGYNNMPGTNWTIASHVSTLCGVPLVMYFQSIGNTKGEKKFLPNLYCVSDWFDEHGYYTYFAQSSYMEFVGTSEFVRLHGFKKAEGGFDLVNRNPAIFIKQTSNNGYRAIKDRAFFEIFKSKITKIANSNKNFFISGTTLDTHFPLGYHDDKCTQKYGDMRDVVKCTSFQVAEFIDWFKKQSFYDDTILIVTGDHLMMPSNIEYLLQQVPTRKTYNIVIGKNIKEQIIYKPFNQFDWAPTILELAGVKWQNHSFGLGTSLLSSEPTLVEKYGAKILEQELAKNSKVYESFL